MIKNLIVFGTRPEAIKMAPLVKEFRKNPLFETRVCVTAQHREMLDQVLDFFDIKPYYDLNLMKPNQNLYSLTADIMMEMVPVLEDFKPDYVFVHGDTTTSAIAALASFYAGARICHIEAGLRTYDKWSPFPEEMNRQLTGRLADFHFAPTEKSCKNLIQEGVPQNNVFVTGNTVIDALFESAEIVKNLKNEEIDYLSSFINSQSKIILVTGHRRENHGQGFINICEALKEIALSNPAVQIIYPVHLNPNVKTPVYNVLQNVPNIFLVPPVSYPAFIWLMNKSYLIITDSGGVQEEAPSLGKPVLVMRETTERPEAVEAGTVILVGTDKNRIIMETQSLLSNLDKYTLMTSLNNPYGDGKACEKIVNFITELSVLG